MQDYWIDRRQVTGFIGSLFIILGIFLPLYELNLFSFGQRPISLIDIPYAGVPVAITLVILAIISIIALAFDEYSLLFLTGAISLIITLSMFFLIELGMILVTGNLPGVLATVVHYLLNYSYGWIILVTGPCFLIATSKW